MSDDDLFGDSADDFADDINYDSSASSNLTLEQASRFLSQATCGPTRDEIDRLKRIGIDTWLDEQFSMSRPQGHWSWLRSRGVDDDRSNGPNGPGKKYWDASIWRMLITAPDQLRQRVALALLDTMVVGIDGLNEDWVQFAMANYVDLLLDNAFGNYRDILGAITTSSAMGQYLTFISSSREDVDGTMPDENYARELMQLFTIGLWRLKLNGDVLVIDGEPQPTYTQDDVSQLARVFTGMRHQNDNFSTPNPHSSPLVIDPATNERGDSYFLRTTIPGGGMKAVDAALDVLFNHYNTAPFFAKTLIRRLVTSNPSRGYIRRVARVFRDNGSGVRGDMKAIIRAVLTDREARSDGALTAPHTGKVRDPVLRLTHWARAFGLRSPSGDWSFPNISSSVVGIGQAPGHSPSVFNFFRPGYSPPQSELIARGLVAPELQIANEQSVIGYVNYMASAVLNNNVRNTDTVSDESWLLPLARNAEALVAEVNLTLAAGQLSPAEIKLIVNAVNSFRPTNDFRRRRRVITAVLLTLVSPGYLVLK